MKRALILLASLSVLAYVGLHTFVGGWEIPCARASAAATPVPYGVNAAGTDNLSYYSWVQQAVRGDWRFRSLYTTTPHEPLLFNPLFLAVGLVARVAGASPILIFNIAALLCIPLFIACVAKTARLVGLTERTTLLVVILCLGGGGISWLRYLSHVVGLGLSLRIWQFAPDLTYLDLYPASAFSVYPYHSVSLTVLAVLCTLLARVDDPCRAMTAWLGSSLAAVGGLAASIHPYEAPTVIVSVWGLVALSLVLRVPRALLRRRIVVAVILSAGCMPFMAFSGWASSRPVWEEMARLSLSITHSDWAGAFLVLWVLAIAGAFLGGAGALARPSGLFVVWSALCASILIVASSGLTKLCSGCTIPLSLAAGIALDRIALFRGRQVRSTVAAFALVICAIGSPVLVHLRILARPERVDPDLLRAVAAIRPVGGERGTTVLTDPDTGVYLPGLYGFQVFCGHWSLTDGFEVKRALLARVGFSLKATEGRDSCAIDQIRSWATLLREQIGQGIFEHVLVRKGCPLGLALAGRASVGILYSGARYDVLRMTPRVRAEVEERLMLIEAGATETRSRAGLSGG